MVITDNLQTATAIYTATHEVQRVEFALANAGAPFVAYGHDASAVLLIDPGTKIDVTVTDVLTLLNGSRAYLVDALRPALPARRSASARSASRVRTNTSTV